MIAWWNDLSQREKLLIFIMSGLIAMLAVSLLIVRPVIGFRESANQNLLAAQNTAALVNQAVQAAQLKSTSIQSTDNLRGVITSSAQQSGLRWINIRQSQDNLMITISFSNVQTDKLYSWLIDLQEKRNIVVRDARISDTRSGGGIEATLTLVQGA